jgi:type II secretory pathway component GspD/PulD (secretin)
MANACRLVALIPHVVSLTLVALLPGGVWAQGAAQVDEDRDILTMEFPYQAIDAPLEQVLLDISRRSGIIVQQGQGVEGTVTIEGTESTLVEVLSAASAQAGLVWWFDGTILRVDSEETLTTRFIDPQGLSIANIERELRALGIYEPRFVLRASSNGSIVRVSGPQSYVDQVIALIETMNAARRFGADPESLDPTGLYLPRIYRGRPLS